MGATEEQATVIANAIPDIEPLRGEMDRRFTELELQFVKGQGSTDPDRVAGEPDARNPGCGDCLQLLLVLGSSTELTTHQLRAFSFHVYPVPTVAVLPEN